MRINHNVTIDGPTTAKFTAYGYSGATLMQFGAYAGKMGTVVDDTGLTGKFAIGLNAADAETIRIPLPTGSGANGESFLTSSTYCSVSTYDSVVCSIDKAIASLSAGFDLVSGTPTAVATVAAGFRPGAVVPLSCIHVGASTATLGYALLGTNGVITVDSAVTAAYPVHVEGSWTAVQ